MEIRTYPKMCIFQVTFGCPQTTNYNKNGISRSNGKTVESASRLKQKFIEVAQLEIDQSKMNWRNIGLGGEIKPTESKKKYVLNVGEIQIDFEQADWERGFKRGAAFVEDSTVDALEAFFYLERRYMLFLV